MWQTEERREERGERFDDMRSDERKGGKNNMKDMAMER
jgi:hypothetical protein